MAADLNQASLLYRTGQNRNFRLPPEGEVTLGYSGNNAVSIPIEGVSRRHAKISFDGKDYWIEDTGSSNGTFLNGARISKRERLRHLDVVTLGRFTDLIFVHKAVETPRVARRGIRAAWLEVLNGPEADTRSEIPRGSMTIGRAVSNNVVTESSLVSKIHVRLEHTGLNLVLTDLHSSNGTFMEGLRLAEPRLLKDGDEFTLGGVRRFRVRIEEGEVETSGVGLSLPEQSRFDQSLPMDWKTRMEWSPEEIAVLEAHKGESLTDTELRRKRQEQGAGPAARPAAQPGEKPAPPPATAPETKQGPPPTAPREARATPAAAGPSKPPAPLSSEPKPRPPAPGVPASEAKLPDSASTQVAAKSPSSSEAQPSPKEKPALPEPSAQPAVRPDASPPPPPLPEPAASSSASPPEATRILAPKAATRSLHLEGKTRTFVLPMGNHEVGRIPGMTVRLEGTEISRRHARIRVGDQDVVVEDLGSSNGTFVNMERITAPRRLGPGDLVQFGDVGFRVRFVPEIEGERKP